MTLNSFSYQTDLLFFFSFIQSGLYYELKFWKISLENSVKTKKLHMGNVCEEDFISFDALQIELLMLFSHIQWHPDFTIVDLTTDFPNRHSVTRA